MTSTGSFVVAVVEPLIQVGLQLVNRCAELLPERFSEELIQRRSAEPLHETAGPGSGNPGETMLYVVERRERLAGVLIGLSPVFLAVVGEHRLDGGSPIKAEGKHPVVRDIGWRDGDPGGMELGECA